MYVHLQQHVMLCWLLYLTVSNVIKLKRLFKTVQEYLLMQEMIAVYELVLLLIFYQIRPLANYVNLRKIWNSQVIGSKIPEIKHKRQILYWQGTEKKKVFPISLVSVFW